MRWFARGMVMALLLVVAIGVAPAPAQAAQHQWGAMYLYWNWSGDGFWNLDQNVRIDRKANATYWALQFTWTDDPTTGGYMGLQTDGVRPDGTLGETALFSLWNSNAAQGPHCQPFGGEGVGHQCKMAYPFQTNRLYRYRIWRLEADAGGQWWGGWIKDQATGVETYLGKIRVAGTHTLIHSPMNFVEYFGTAVPCDQVPVSEAIFTQLAGNHLGGGVYQYGSTFRSWDRASCTGGWAAYYSSGSVVGTRVVMGGPTPVCNQGIWIAGTVGGQVKYTFVPAYNGSYNCVMSSGSQSWGVVALQNALKRCYGQNIAVDGIFGPATRTALLNAQTWEQVVYGEQIAVDGIYGIRTNQAMLWPFYANTGNLDAPMQCVDPL